MTCAEFLSLYALIFAFTAIAVGVVVGFILGDHL